MWSGGTRLAAVVVIGYKSSMSNVFPPAQSRTSRNKSRDAAGLAALLVVLAGVCVLLLGSQRANFAPTPSALESDSQGWVDIMPPADLKGWSRVPVPPGGQLGRAQWHVDTSRHVLICDGDGGHDMLLYDKPLGDVIFHFEFRYIAAEGLKGYNSGAYVRNSRDGAIWHQAQLGDAQGGYLFGVTPAAGGGTERFNLRKEVKDNRVRPAGEWNTMEITARGRTLTLWVNGAVTCQFDQCGQARGFVGVEGEGFRVEFRNLKVKELP
jgi:hypothetical protein